MLEAGKEECGHVDRPFGCPAQERLELGEGVLGGTEVGLESKLAPATSIFAATRAGPCGGASPFCRTP